MSGKVSVTSCETVQIMHMHTAGAIMYVSNCFALGWGDGGEGGLTGKHLLPGRMYMSTVDSTHAAHLMVALQRLGQGVVDDEAHIWLVDAHAKGNGGSNDLHLVCRPVLLHSLPLIWCQASMVVPAHLILSSLAAHGVYTYSCGLHDCNHKQC